MEDCVTTSPSELCQETGHDPGKMFIGGLSWQTTPESLRDYFANFGELKECIIMRDPNTKRSRGFGFVTYKDPKSMDNVVNHGAHRLDGKLIDPKIAFPRKAQPKPVTRTKKIFVGGLTAQTTVEDMKKYFADYGNIEDAMLMFDNVTKRHRGFGFVTFECEDIVEKVCEIHYHEINNKMVECKKAQPKEVMTPTNATRNRNRTFGTIPGNMSCVPDQNAVNYAALLNSCYRGVAPTAFTGHPAFLSAFFSPQDTTRRSAAPGYYTGDLVGLNRGRQADITGQLNLTSTSDFLRGDSSAAALSAFQQGLPFLTAQSPNNALRLAATTSPDTTLYNGLPQHQELALQMAPIMLNSFIKNTCATLTVAAAPKRDLNANTVGVPPVKRPRFMLPGLS